jgi:hypothetical protein
VPAVVNLQLDNAVFLLLLVGLLRVLLVAEQAGDPTVVNLQLDLTEYSTGMQLTHNVTYHNFLTVVVMTGVAP